jgi:hypothetical protein
MGAVVNTTGVVVNTTGVVLTTTSKHRPHDLVLQAMETMLDAANVTHTVLYHPLVCKGLPKDYLTL